MLSEAKQLIEEIKQIRIQYVAEVGSGRRAWPKSIKDRAAKLDEMGLPVKALSKACGISYDTLILWRYKRRHEVTACPSMGDSGFHELAVLENGISKSESVTVPKIEMPRSSVVALAGPEPGIGNLRVTTPNGFVIEGINEASLASVLRSLSTPAGGSYAF